MALFGPLRFLYVGSDDTDRDVAWYEKGGAKKLWRYQEFGAIVAALDVGPGPLLLLADHRDAGTVLPVYEVDKLKPTVQRLIDASWEPTGPPFGIPNGPCRMFKDPSGNELALFEDARPGALGQDRAGAP
jgi:hypothetical protein